MTHPLPRPHVKSSKKKELQPEKPKKNKKEEKKKKKISCIYFMYQFSYILSVIVYFLYSQWKFFYKVLVWLHQKRTNFRIIPNQNSPFAELIIHFFFLILIFFLLHFFTFRGREEINYNYIILGQDNICK